MALSDALVRPLITEKSMGEAGKGKFTFLIANTAHKDVVKRAIEEKYGVNVTDIATMYVKGKRKRVGKRRAEVNIASYKKAVITLRKGQKLDMFELGS